MAVQVVVEHVSGTIAERIAQRVRASGVDVEVRPHDDQVEYDLTSAELRDAQLRALFSNAVVRIVGHFDNIQGETDQVREPALG